ncbi:MAG TPA: Maf family nucleotide pyrophosphatase [Bacteroidales bacterium]|nr:Maf family nucleotide pyrophosphatase [Bacteroidales bacterium]HPI68884.1 Maf family nucleotide pyrophosphatase [Bacteroidales bacterium]HPR73420.1 Maf family nucleotide pyrophosphatase [Bacteroidales bacterium]
MFLDNINKYRLILASKSPRRQQLLRDLGLKFEVSVKDYAEVCPDDLSGEDIALYLSREKAKCFRNDINRNEIIITADTIVWSEGRVLSKPAEAEEARLMLRDLSDKTHEVITGVTLLSLAGERTFSDTTEVTFDSLSDDEIDYYIEQYKPFDKAGAYGIQEWLGLAACSRIEGSFFNVVGLPVNKFFRELQSLVSEMKLT